MTFREHTYERRQKITTRWYLDEMVFGEIGPNDQGTGHAVNSHFRQQNGGYPMALNDVLDLVKDNWGNLITPHPINFESLYARVEDLTNKVHGAGKMVTYDVALHIGCNIYPKVLPDKYVYLTSDKVIDAARVLVPTINKTDIKVYKSVFDPWFKYYQAMDIEDALCLYSDDIVNNGNFEKKWLNNVPNSQQSNKNTSSTNNP